MNRIACLFFFCIGIGFSGLARAQSNPLMELYGQGVHAYFAGDLQKANELLTTAIDAGTRDPRAYYFRGLVQTRQGGIGAGMADYETGADVEYGVNRGLNVNVPKALERIQGPMRAELEKVRQAARLASRDSQATLQRSRLESLRQSGTVPAIPSEAESVLDGRLTPGNPREMPSAPRGDDQAAPVPEVIPADDQPAAPEADPFGGNNDADPFGDDSAPSDAPADDAPASDSAAEDDPFGT